MMKFAAIQRERDRLALETYKKKVRKEGLAEGIAKEKLINVHRLVRRVYNDEACWLDKCTLEQLDYALDIILDKLDYNEFKDKVLNLQNIYLQTL